MATNNRISVKCSTSPSRKHALDTSASASILVTRFRELDDGAMKTRMLTRQDDTETPMMFGHAAVTDKWVEIEDWYGTYKEKIQPGAFKKTLQEKADVRALQNHDPNRVFGRTPKTLRLEEDKTGLYYEVDLDTDISYVADAVKLVERGDITQCSIAFYVVKQEWDGDYTERIIKEVKLVDVSPVVTYPAYEMTDVQLKANRAESIISRAAAGCIRASEMMPKLMASMLADRSNTGITKPGTDAHLADAEPSGNDHSSTWMPTREEEPVVGHSKIETELYVCRLRLLRARYGMSQNKGVCTRC